MSNFELADQGEGRFALSGEVSFATAEQILRSSEKSFAGESDIEVDMSGVQKTDSAGLALLLEWISSRNQSGAKIRFVSIPEKVRLIAQTAEIEELLDRPHSSSSK